MKSSTDSGAEVGSVASCSRNSGWLLLPRPAPGGVTNSACDKAEL